MSARLGHALEFATGINNQGEIVGNAYTPEGDLHVVVLVPIAGE